MIVRFRVRIEDPETGAVSEDEAWEVWSGGGEIRDCKAPTQGPAPEIGPITLRGPMTAGRSALADWITDTVRGEPWQRKVTITEIVQEPDGSEKDGRTFTYHDCFPIRYVMPALSAAGTGNLYEEVDIKPIRLELA